MHPTPLLEMRGIEKSFPGVRALRGVDLRLHEGEVLALLGENGAGKSTLIKVLGGAYQPDAGQVLIKGEPVTFLSPADAQHAGIGVIYQEFNLIPGLTACENIFLGREHTFFGAIRRREEEERAQALFDRTGVKVDLRARCDALPVAHQQVVEIAKALSLDARILVMDEPTATLTPREVASLHAIIQDLKSQGIGIIYISHRLEEIFAIAGRVTVLRDGENVGSRAVEDISRKDLIELMVGRKLENEYPARTPSPGAIALEVNGLNRRPDVKDVSLNVRRGEIVALTGLVGSGRTETARLIAGADRAESGEIKIDGHRAEIRSPAAAIAAGVCLLTEDRKSQGLIGKQSVLENFGLPNLQRFSTAGVLHQRQEREQFQQYTADLQVKVASPSQPARNLSGGNQQKVVLAKWLQADSNILIFDEPTRGIDVGAKFQIYQLMNQLAAAGKAILMITSELPEALGMADRIYVMHEGTVAGEIPDARTATQEQIMSLAVQG